MHGLDDETYEWMEAFRVFGDVCVWSAEINTAILITSY